MALPDLSTGSSDPRPDPRPVNLYQHRRRQRRANPLLGGKSQPIATLILRSRLIPRSSGCPPAVSYIRCHRTGGSPTQLEASSPARDGFWLPMSSSALADDCNRQA